MQSRIISVSFQVLIFFITFFVINFILLYIFFFLLSLLEQMFALSIISYTVHSYKEIVVKEGLRHIPEIIRYVFSFSIAFILAAKTRDRRYVIKFGILSIIVSIIINAKFLSDNLTRWKSATEATKGYQQYQFEQHQIGTVVPEFARAIRFDVPNKPYDVLYNDTLNQVISDRNHFSRTGNIHFYLKKQDNTLFFFNDYFISSSFYKGHATEKNEKSEYIKKQATIKQFDDIVSPIRVEIWFD